MKNTILARLKQLGLQTQGRFAAPTSLAWFDGLPWAEVERWVSEWTLRYGGLMESEITQILVNLLFVVGHSADHYSAEVLLHTKGGFNALLEVVSDHTIPYGIATNDLSVRGIFQLVDPIRLEKRTVHPLRGRSRDEEIKKQIKPFFKKIPRTLVV